MKPQILVLLLLFMAACQAPKTSLTPERTSMELLAQKENRPRRAASLRLVEGGRKDLTTSRFGQAAQKFSQAIEVDAGNPYAYFYLGVARYRTGRFDESAEIFLRSSNLFVDANDWRAEALTRRGESFEKIGRIEDARLAYERARKIDFGNERAHKGWYRLSDQM